MRVVGIDEAGRGPVIGPMVIAGVLIDETEQYKLLQLRVKDSKLLSPNARETLFQKIIDTVRAYHIIIIPPEEIDNAIISPELNLNFLEALKIIEIIGKLKPEKAIIDCPSNNVKAYKDYVFTRLADKSIKLVLEHKADAVYPIVSAASILAKVIRDREIDKLKKKYGKIGSGYPSDPDTQKFLQENPDLPIYRKTWATWQTVKRQEGQKNLSDFK